MAAALLALGATPAALRAQVPGGAPDSTKIQVLRDSVASVYLWSDALAKLPRVEVKAAEHGRTGTFRGVRLSDVLRLAGVPVDSVRGPRASLYVLVSAADGYRALFSLAELAPGLGGREVLLADQRDGRPLAADEGPFRLVVPNDGRPTRWARRVTTLSIRSGVP
jgi:hypothetical protein